MKLARRIALAMALVVVVVLGLQALAAVQRERNLLEGDMERDHLVAARAVSAAMIQAWKTEGFPAVARLLAASSRSEDNLRFGYSTTDGRTSAGRVMLPAFDAAAEARLGAGEPVTLRLQPRAGSAAAERLATYVPLASPEGAAGVLVVEESLAEADRYVRYTVLRTAGFALLLAALCSVLTLAIGAVLVGRPVRELVHHARAVGGGDLTVRSHPSRDDELGELGEEMNAMSGRLLAAREALASETERRLQALSELRHADRLTTVGKLAAGLAHELGTPLNVVRGHAKLIVDESAVPDDAREGARVIVEQTDRMTNLVRQLLDFARRRAPRKEPVALDDVCGRAATMLQSLATKRGVVIVPPAGGKEVEARVDPAGLQQIVTNLVINAIHASPRGGKVTVACDRCDEVRPPPEADASPAGYIRVVVTDEGPGVAPEIAERIFEPFFTTKPVGEGTGLGLSVSYGIAHDHGGWIGVDRAPAGGARFSVFLPRDAGAA